MLKKTAVFIGALLLIALSMLRLWWLSLEPLALNELRLPPSSAVVLDRRGEPLRVYLSNSGEWCMPVSLDQMGVWIPRICVQVEDKRFYEHLGLDPLAILRAAFQNISQSKIVSGGSTISSQIFRILRPKPRTLASKVEEFSDAMRLEKSLDKRTILEIYLNIAPFGGNVRGVESASRLYFGKSAKELSLSEAVMLVGLLQGPSRMRPDRYPEKAKAKRDMILDKLFKRAIISEREYKAALLEAVPSVLIKQPQWASNASDYIRSISEGTIIRSTMDMAIQRKMENVITAHLALLPKEITASAIVVDNKTGSVRGYVGNARWGNGLPGSWVDCGQSPRSPGSALKPFVYAIALDSGLISPSSLLADTPMGLGGETPRNFDLYYRGPVSVRTALADSLNVPAVRVLRMNGTAPTLDFLRDVGFKHLTEDSTYYGYSLVLGGCEVTLLEMAEAYLGMARLGDFIPLRWIESDLIPKKGRHFVSEEAAFIVADILKDTGRLLPIYGNLFGGKGKGMAFKTGTSYGLRDAWTISYNPEYTVVVWLGDPSGEGHSNLVGLSVATPLAMKIFRIVSGEKPGWYDTPPGVRTREVCALSGMPPSIACDRRRTEWYIAGISPSDICYMHRLKDGQSVTIWPRDLSDYFQSRKNEKTERANFAIVSPRKDARYIFHKDMEGQRVPLKAEGGKGKHFWFIDGEFFCVSETGINSFWSITPGVHHISVADEGGESASVTIQVSGN